MPSKTEVAWYSHEIVAFQSKLFLKQDQRNILEIFPCKHLKNSGGRPWSNNFMSGNKGYTQ